MLTAEDKIAEQLAQVKPWQVLVGRFVEPSGVESVVVAGGSTGGLNILVAGDASRTVRWVMRLTTVEVGV